MKDTDLRYTPEWLLELVRDFCGGPIPLDVAASADNRVEALEWISATRRGRQGSRPEASGGAHTERWQPDVEHPNGCRVAWCNPPYSVGQLRLWSQRALDEARRGAEILMLTRADVRTTWFETLRRNVDAVCLINRSVGFVHPVKGQLPGDTVGHALWYWGPQRPRFRRLFDPLGWVIDGPGVGELGAVLRECLGLDRSPEQSAEADEDHGSRGVQDVGKVR